MKTETADLIGSAEEFHERGFRHFGLKIGVEPAADFKNAEALRARFGDDVVLRVDANGAMTFDAALALLKRLEQFEIDAAEQPVALWDVESLAALARSVAIPIMADECVSTDHSLIDVIRPPRRDRGANEGREEWRHLLHPPPLGPGAAPPGCASIPATIPAPAWRRRRSRICAPPGRTR